MDESSSLDTRTIDESQGIDKPQIIKLQNLKKGELEAYLLSKRFSNAFQESEEQRTLLAQAKSEIEKLSKTKDEFLANLSHELKTPHLYFIRM